MGFRGPPAPADSQVGSCNCCFGTCSAFTLVMACTLAESPSDLFIESSDSSVASAAASIASGWNEPVPGRELHPLKSSASHGALLRQLMDAAVQPSGHSMGIFREGWVRSYIVRRKGNPESFMGCSHGAGRAMSLLQNNLCCYKSSPANYLCAWCLQFPVQLRRK